MKRNRIPTTVRLRLRIDALVRKIDESRHHDPKDPNPYWACRFCGVRDPALYCTGGRHSRGCPMQGAEKTLEHYKRLLEAAVVEEASSEMCSNR